MKGARSKAGRATSRLVGCALLVLLPFLAGGCPDFRDALVNTADNATRDLIFERQPTAQVTETIRDDLINAALDLVFDQFRSNQLR